MLCLYPIKQIRAEYLRFDTQLMQDPTINGIQYQQGTVVKMVDFSYKPSSAIPADAV